MTNKDDEFFEKLLIEFKDEAEGHLHAISEGLLELEKKPNKKLKNILIENIYRQSHTLKGSARVLNLTLIENICQGMEDIYLYWKNSNFIISLKQFDLLHLAIDLIQNLLIKETKGDIEIDLSKINKITKKLNKFKNYKPTPKSPLLSKNEFSHTPLLLSDSLKVSTKKIDTLMLKAEEIIIIKIILDQQLVEIQDIVSNFEAWKCENYKESSEIRHIKNFLDNSKHKLLDDFLNKNYFNYSHINKKLTTFSQQMERNRHNLGNLVDEFLDQTKEIIILPFSTVLDYFPKMVRDLSRNQQKNINLKIEGSNIEIDKRILNEIKEALIHIIRNSVDHGIEKSETRVNLNKNPQGLIKIIITQFQADQVEIKIIDDGAGINQKAVKTAAINQGNFTTADIDHLNENETLNLIFHSGISTNTTLNEISGRGLGMAIVKEKIEKMGGQIFIDSKLNEWTIIKIIIPVALAIYNGIVVQVENQQYIIPTANIERVLRVKSKYIKFIENTEAVRVDGKILSFYNLADILEVPEIPNQSNRREGEDEYVQAIVINSNDNRIVFKVGQILQAQEILIKNFSYPLVHIRNFSGATIIGSGKAIPILNVGDLIKSAIKKSLVSKDSIMKKVSSFEKKIILLVDDSITTRILLKNVIEGAGYEVITANDGVSAILALESNKISLVVSDVDMPNINGLELTTHIRKNTIFSDLPVILVTAADDQSEIEKGINVGADAYILKQKFDSTKLLETINRLI